MIAELIGTEAAFGVTAGDVVYDDLTLYPRRNRLFVKVMELRRHAAVSNGLEVVRSGLDGRYSLPIAEGDGLFVTKPAGYAPPVDRSMAPQFHYFHEPEGTPAEGMSRSMLKS